MLQRIRRCIAVLLSGAMIISMSCPAYADVNKSSVGPDASYTVKNGEAISDDNITKPHTEVMLIANDNITVTVPLLVVLAVKADHSVLAPTEYKISNNGMIAVNIAKAVATPKDNFNFSTSRPTGDSPRNAMTLALTQRSSSTIPVASGTEYISDLSQAETLSASHKINLYQEGNTDKRTVWLDFSGYVDNIDKDLTTQQNAFTMTYTIKAGSASS